MTCLDDAINRTIEEHIMSVIEYMHLGLDKPKAIELAKRGSCLTDKVWRRILAEVDERIASHQRTRP